MTAVVNTIRKPNPISYFLHNMPTPERVAMGGADDLMLLMQQDRTVVLRLSDKGNATVLQTEREPIKGSRSRIAWKRNGEATIFAACSAGGTVVVWDVTQSRAIASHQADQAFTCNALAVSPGGRYVAIGGSDGRAMLFDIENPGLSVKLTDKGPSISDISFNEGMTRLALVTVNLATVVADLSVRNLTAQVPSPSKDVGPDVEADRGVTRAP